MLMQYDHMITLENIRKSDMKNGNVTNWHVGSLASPGDLEESASHHVLFTIHKHMKTLRVSAAKFVQKL